VGLKSLQACLPPSFGVGENSVATLMWEKSLATQPDGKNREYHAMIYRMQMLPVLVDFKNMV
jgi:hypothetical protein